MNSKAKVEQVTFRLKGTGGQCVYVGDGIFLTAAHCINWEGTGGMMLGDFFVEEIVAGDSVVKVGPIAVEPCLDIAALGELDSQSFPEDSMILDDFCSALEPTTICTTELEVEQRITAWVLSHTGEWIEGTVTQYGQRSTPSLWFTAEKKIKGGSSGGPIVDEEGQLLGIVSSFSDNDYEQGCCGRFPRPHLTLPRWIVGRIAKLETIEF